jgi:pyrroline-5-carboxylate reductase
VNITFIGGGHMAQAIIGGLLAKGQSPKDVRVVEINADTLEQVKLKFGVMVFSETQSKAIEGADVIILAVKPQQVFEVAARLQPLPKQIVISLAAGIKLTDLMQRMFGKGGGQNYTLVRAMPNTPALIGEGITGLYSFPPKKMLSLNKTEMIERIVGAIGKYVWVNNDDEMNAVTAISGSGPAYVFLFMEAIEQAAAELKLPRDAARELVLQTFIGTSKLAAESPDSLAALRERVTSKGGTTEAALKSMAKDQVKETIIRAVKAAHERARELGEEFGKQ